MTVKEFARLMGRSRSTIYKYIRDGLIRAHKVGRRWKITEEIDMAEWPKLVNQKHAKADGLGPEHFQYEHMIVANVRLRQPDYTLPREVSLVYCCSIPPATPQANQYDENNQKIPDPVGMCLQSVDFQLVDANTRDVLDESLAANHVNGDVTAFLSGPCKLWDVLKPGGMVEVRLCATPDFFYLNEQGGMVGYANTPNGQFPGEMVESPVYILRMDEDGNIFVNGDARPEAPEDTEGLKEREEADRKMREEREAHERQERETKDRAARENRENDERIEREKREAEEADKKAQEEAEAERKRHDAEMKAEEERAAKERERLGIKSGGDDVWDKLTNPEPSDSTVLALANLWSSQYAPNDRNGFKAQLAQIRNNPEYKVAVDEVCRRLGWTI